jgi:hypothetical protein
VNSESKAAIDELRTQVNATNDEDCTLSMAHATRILKLCDSFRGLIAGVENMLESPNTTSLDITIATLRNELKRAQNGGEWWITEENQNNRRSRAGFVDFKKAYEIQLYAYNDLANAVKDYLKFIRVSLDAGPHRNPKTELEYLHRMRVLAAGQNDERTEWKGQPEC